MRLRSLIPERFRQLKTPGPAEEMRQSEACINPVVIADPDVTQPPPGNVMLNIKQAWQYSTGAGVAVAIIDTGVTANPRFPQLYRAVTTFRAWRTVASTGAIVRTMARLSRAS